MLSATQILYVSELFCHVTAICVCIQSIRIFCYDLGVILRRKNAMGTPQFSYKAHGRKHIYSPPVATKRAKPFQRLHFFSGAKKPRTIRYDHQYLPRDLESKRWSRFPL